MRTFPERTTNKNVPQGSLLVAEVSAMSGEIITTYYTDGKKVYKVTDWIGHKPYEISRQELFDETLIPPWKVNDFIMRELYGEDHD